MVAQSLGPDKTMVRCPQCNQNVVTRVDREVSMITHCWAFTLCLIGYIDDINHYVILIINYNKMFILDVGHAFGCHIVHLLAKMLIIIVLIVEIMLDRMECVKLMTTMLTSNQLPIVPLLLER